MSKPLILASVTFVALAGTALAADLPRREPAPPPVAVAPAFTFAGFYVGTHTGVIATEGDIKTRGNTADTIVNVATGRRPEALSTETDASRLAGLQAGYNLQFGSFLIGVEADISKANVTTREAYLSSLGDFSAFRRDLDYFGTVRGRVGVVFDQVLVYGTGGVAFADITNRAAFFRNTDLALQFAGRSSDVETGYAVGGGIEFQLPTFFQNFNFVGRLIGAKSVTVKAEYLYFDLGDKDVPVPSFTTFGGNSYTSNIETTGHIGRIGFNYRFGT